MPAPRRVPAEEISRLIKEELAKVAGCAGVETVGVIRVDRPGQPNWIAAIVDPGSADAALCSQALPPILERLHRLYVLETRAGMR